MNNLDWMADAACRDEDPDLFFPNSTGPAARRQAAEAARVCAHCPVRAECSEHRGRTGASSGIWGGSYHKTKPPGSEQHRTRQHGTDAGYTQHLARRETPCHSCRMAHNYAQSKRAKSRRGTL